MKILFDLLRYYVYTNYLSPTLSLDQKWRNTFVFCSATLWVFIMINLTIRFMTGPIEWYFVLSNASSICIACLLPVGLVRAHLQPRVTDGTITLLFQTFVVAVTLSAVKSAPTRPVQLQALILLALITIANMPYWKTQCLFALPPLLIYTYNATFALFGYPFFGYMMKEVDLKQELISHGIVYCIIALFLVALRTLSVAYNQSAQRLEGSVKVAKDVSAFLTAYNTTAAQVTLDEYRLSAHYDGDLHSVLTMIVNDLKKYKPFLPNYIVTNEKEEMEEIRNKQLLRSTESTQNSIETVMTEVQVFSPTGPTTTPPLVEARASASSPSQLLFSRKSSYQRKFLASSIEPTVRSVSYALIDFRMFNEDFVDTHPPLRNFIDKVYEYANTTNGAVHTCIGDTVHITWNAALPVSHPALTAVGIFPHLQTQDNLVQIRGSVTSGSAECHVAGSTHQTFLLHNSSWGYVNQRLIHQFVRRSGTNAVCLRTADKVHRIHPILRVDVLDNEVDVYVLTSHEVVQKYSEVMDKVLKLAVRGEYEDALFAMQNITESFLPHHHPSPLVLPTTITATTATMMSPSHDSGSICYTSKTSNAVSYMEDESTTSTSPQHPSFVFCLLEKIQRCQKHNLDFC